MILCKQAHWKKTDKRQKKKKEAKEGFKHFGLYLQMTNTEQVPAAGTLHLFMALF